jgi:hypothetical protein
VGASSASGLDEERLALAKALVVAGGVTAQMIEHELEATGKQGSVLGKALKHSGYANEEHLLAALVATHRVPKLNLKNTKVPVDTVGRIPEELAKKLKFLAIDQVGMLLVVVTPEVTNLENIAALRRELGFPLCLIQCAADGFEEILAQYYTRYKEKVKKAEEARLAEEAAKAPPPAPVAAPAAPAAAVAAPVPAADMSSSTLMLSSAMLPKPIRRLKAAAVAADPGDAKGATPLAADARAQTAWEWNQTEVGPVQAIEAFTD